MHRRTDSRHHEAMPTGRSERQVSLRRAAVIAAALVAAIAPVASVVMKEAEAAAILAAITSGTAIVPPGTSMTLGVAGAGMILGAAGSDCSAATPCWPAFGSRSSATVATLTDAAGVSEEAPAPHAACRHQRSLVRSSRSGGAAGRLALRAQHLLSNTYYELLARTTSDLWCACAHVALARARAIGLPDPSMAPLHSTLSMAPPPWDPHHGTPPMPPG